jgi:hypothetical protein
MIEAIQIIQADMQHYIARGLPIQAYDGEQALPALIAADVNLEELVFTPAELVGLAIVDRCIRALEQ